MILILETGRDHRWLAEVLLATDGLKRLGARHVTVALPYLPYSRQDTKTAPCVEVIKRTLAAGGVDHLVTLDQHSPSHGVPTTSLDPTPLFLDALRGTVDVVVAPDAGAAARSRRLADGLGCGVMLLRKKRGPSGVCEMTGDSAVEGKRCIIVDDIVDSGGTLVAAAEFLHERGAQNVAAVATHAILSGNAKARLEASHLAWLLTTNSLKHHTLSPFFKVFAIEAFLERALRDVCASAARRG